MTIWAILATLLAMIAVLTGHAYRRQIRKICRQMAFLKENQTNLHLTSGLPFPELNDLIDSINDSMDASREIQRVSRQNEENLKETITNLSHDIRTPLTSMDGYFQLLSQSTSEEERRHYIGIIQSRISSLKDLLEELFTYTKIQDEQYVLPLEPLDFGRCVFEAVFSFYDEFEKKGIEPQIDFCEEQLPMTGNPEAIRRALQNIIKNALEHGRQQIVFRTTKEEQQVIFQCTNDVESPDEIDMTKIFSRFYKADLARGSTSTGLGLSIVKGLTEKMGGTITAELEGSLFSVKISFPQL